MKSNNFDYLQKFRKYEFLLIGVTVIVFVVFLTVKLMIPNILKARDMNQNKLLLINKLSNLEKKNKILQSIDENNFRSNFGKLNYVVPENKDYALLFTTLDDLQNKNGISITRTDFELGSVASESGRVVKNKKEASPNIPISLELIGNYDQVQGFISNLSDLSGRLIMATEIKLQLLGPGIVKANINGLTYFNSLPKTLGKVDSPIPEFNESYQSIYDRIEANQYPIEAIDDSGQTPLGRDNLFF